jgi:hypothetical protein
MISLRHFAVAALLPLAVAGCDGITASLPEQGPPEELEFSTAGFGGTSARVTLRGDTVMLTRAPWERGPGTVADTVRAVPDAAAWRQFWRAAENSGVERWKRRYMAENIADGVGWGLRIVVDGETIESGGSNAFPDRDGREHENRETPEYRAFVDALGALVGRRIEGAPGS